jgi:hypothetical protein
MIRLLSRLLQVPKLYLFNLKTQPRSNNKQTLRERMLRETEEYLNRHLCEAV